MFFEVFRANSRRFCRLVVIKGVIHTEITYHFGHHCWFVSQENTAAGKLLINCKLKADSFTGAIQEFFPEFRLA